VSAVALAVASLSAADPAAAQVRRFNIPAQPIARAIAAFGQQSGIQIVAPADGMEHVLSRSVHGTADARAALRQLIADTGLAIAQDAGGRIVLARSAPHPINDPQTGVDSAPPADVVVSGLRASLATARDIKRRSDSIVDVIAAEDINQLPDNSATEALARLPGVQVFRNRGEAQAITLRGLTQVLTTLNGQESYTGASRRSLLNSYPANLIRSIEVYKALTPDLVEGGIAGAVNVALREPLDLPKGFTVAGTLRGSYDEQARKVFYNGDILVSRHWETGIGDIGVAVNASYLRRDYLESYRESLQVQTTTAATKVTPAGLGTGLVYPTGILIKRPQGHYTRPVVTGTVQWRPDADLGFKLRATNITDDNTYYDNDLQTAIAATVPLSNVVLVPGTNIVKSATFTPASDSGPRSNHTRQVLDTTQVEFGADWHTGIATLTTSGVYTSSRIDTDQQLMLLAFNKAPTINAVFQSDSRFGGLSYTYPGIDLTDQSQFHVRAYSDSRTRQTGGGLQWRGDVLLDTGDGFFRNLKFGVRYADRSTTYKSGTATADLSKLNLPLSAFPGGGTPALITGGFHGDDVAVPDNWSGYDATYLNSTANVLAVNKFVASQPGMASLFDASSRAAYNPVLAFDGDETSYAMYGQFKYGLHLGGVDVDGVIGARVVNTVLDINGTQMTTTRSPATGNVNVVTYKPINGRQNYLDIDPSASAVVHFSPHLQLRAAYTKTFTRPDFSQLNPSLNLVQVTAASGAYAGTATTGNPDLKPTRSQNYDASLEYYFGRAGLLSAAVFRRDLDGFIVNTIQQQTLPGANGVASVTIPVNGSKGRIDGLELQANGFFDFAPGLLHNFGASLNFTLLDSRQELPAVGTTPAFSGPLTSVSRTSYNAALFYDDSRFRARVAYGERSGFVLAYTLANRANDLIWYPIARLDGSLTYRLSRAISITMDGTNLLGTPQRAHWGDTGVVDRVYFEGRMLSLALRFKY
jgi:TonB-dependent receptor